MDENGAYYTECSKSERKTPILHPQLSGECISELKEASQRPQGMHELGSCLVISRGLTKRVSFILSCFLPFFLPSFLLFILPPSLPFFFPPNLPAFLLPRFLPSFLKAIGSMEIDRIGQEQLFREIIKVPGSFYLPVSSSLVCGLSLHGCKITFGSPGIKANVQTRKESRAGENRKGKVHC